MPESDLNLVLVGAIIGFGIAFPVGPIGILCIQRTLASGRIAGLFSGLGAAVADAIFGAIAGFGLAVIADFLIAQERWIELGGGVILFVHGVRTMFAKPEAGGPGKRLVGLHNEFLIAFVMTLTNPLTLLSFIGAYILLDVAQAATDVRQGVSLVAGVFLGSAGWWLALVMAVGVLRRSISHKGLTWINRVAGIAIAAFGVAAFIAGMLNSRI